MAIPALQTILDRIETWPLERQERAAELLELLDEGDGDLTISDEDAAEIERRMNDPNAETISLEEFDRRMARWLK
jgi:hypothetical protein